MKQLLKEHNIYTLIWCLYYMQGVLYPKGSFIAKGLFLIFILMSLVYFYKVQHLQDKPSLFKAINVLVIMFTIYGTLRMILGSDHTWLMQTERISFIKGYLMSILPIYAYYYFSYNNKINLKWFEIVVFLFFIMSIGKYYEIQALTMIKHDTEEEDVTNNAGYIFLALFPIISLIKKPILQYVILIISLIFIIMAMKRGAILIGAVCFAVFILANLKEQSNSKKILILIFSIAAIFVVYYLIGYMLDSSDHFNARIEQTQEGDASGRSEGYPFFINYIFNQTNVFNILLGNGADSTVRIHGNYAHQDWLEIMMNHGLIGIALYIWYWVCMFKTWWNAKNTCTSNIILATGLFIIIYFMKSMFSMSINGMTIFATSVFGYCLAKYQQTTTSNHNNK